MKPIKIFLGAYINSANAQNLNCRALYKYLDKSKFQVKTMKLYSGTLEDDTDFNQLGEVMKVGYPHRFMRYIYYFKGFIWADIVYCPKGEVPQWINFLLNITQTKSFNTIEGIFDPHAQKNAVNLFGSIENMKKHFQHFDKVYSITRFLKHYNEKNIGLKSENKILYLGADIDAFLNTHKRIKNLSNIILIGNDLVRKGIYEYFALAQSFPNITFHVVGTGNGKIDVLSEISKKSIENVEYHGGLAHDELIKLLASMDLHILPSRSEGFPKVTLETAAAGVPSLVYDDYGADEWITHGKDGYVVHTIEEMKETIKHLKENPKELQEVSKNAIEMAKRFDWKVIIKDWEKIIEDLYYGK